MEAERRARVDRAISWLTRTSPENTEDSASQLFGLRWAGAEPVSLASRRDRLLAEQHADGGWGQIRGRSSDAYATGQALAALNQAAAVAPSHAAFRKRLTVSPRQTEAGRDMAGRKPDSSSRRR